MTEIGAVPFAEIVRRGGNELAVFGAGAVLEEVVGVEPDRVDVGVENGRVAASCPMTRTDAMSGGEAILTVWSGPIVVPSSLVGDDPVVEGVPARQARHGCPDRGRPRAAAGAFGRGFQAVAGGQAVFEPVFRFFAVGIERGVERRPARGHVRRRQGLKLEDEGGNDVRSMPTFFPFSFSAAKR